MNQVISIASAVAFFALLSIFYWMWVTRKDRPAKTRQPKTKPTMYDVRRLLQEGNRDGAISLYIQIFKVPAKQARKDIEEFERNLKV
ncbi:MAG: hypothetical protein KA403_06575 [Candidatus Omnitrophica bacterium]|nr:hypothetical protein [Candidatus Omnitrophota bacterium]